MNMQCGVCEISDVSIFTWVFDNFQVLFSSVEFLNV